MKNKNSSKKVSKPSKELKNKIHYRRIRLENNGQIITLMGITLALSVFVVASLPSQVSDLDIVIPNERSSSLLTEFVHIKETFGTALNYNLVNIEIDPTSGDSILYGYAVNIEEAFEKTRDLFHALELQHDIYFDATFNRCVYSHLSAEGPVIMYASHFL